MKGSSKFYGLYALLCVWLVIFGVHRYLINQGQVTISVIHTSYLRGQYQAMRSQAGTYKNQMAGGLAQLATLIRELRQGALEQGGDAVVVDAGNALLPQSDVEAVNVGALMVQSMNLMHYDALNLGDVDLSLPGEQLLTLMRPARFALLSSNVIQSDQLKSILPIMPYKIIERAGIKIALIGISNPQMHEVSDADRLKGLTFLPYGPSLTRTLDELNKQKVDIKIVLSDIFNYQTEMQLLRDYFDEIDLVVATTQYEEDQRHLIDVHGKHIVKTPRFMTHVGRYDLIFDRKSKRVIDRHWNLFPVVGIEEDSRMVAIVRDYRERFKESYMSMVLGQALNSFQYETVRESRLGSLMTDLILARTSADVALVNSANFVDLPEGPITIMNVRYAIPYDEALVTMDLTGAQLRQILEQSIEQKQLYGILQVGGVRMKFDSTQTQAGRVKSVFIRERPLDDKQVYRVATTEFLYNGGDGYRIFQTAGRNVEHRSERLRHIFTSYVREKQQVSAMLDNRLQDIADQSGRALSCDDCGLEDLGEE